MIAPTGYAPARMPPISVWRAEVIDTIKLAIPLALTQLGQIAMMTSDLVLIGRLGDEAVGAASLGHAVLFSAFMLGLGLVAAVAPLAAQAFGARDPRMVRRALRVGLWAAVLCGMPVTALLLHTEKILLQFGQTPELSALAGRYLDGMAWSLTPAWLFIALRSFMSAINRPQPALWITLCAIPANAHTGVRVDLRRARDFPRSASWARASPLQSSISACSSPACGSAIRNGRFGNFMCSAASGAPIGHCSAKLVLIGLPISAALLLEHGLFAAASLMMGMIGTNALAAHQIALQIAAIVFMVPLGISFAATVRVGHAVGRRDAGGRAARRPCRDHSWHVLSGDHGGLRHRNARHNCRLLFLGDERNAGNCRDRVNAAADRRAVLRRRRPANDRIRRVARLQRYVRAVSVFRDRLLAGRIFAAPICSRSRPTLAPSASGSAC